jgi:RNA polymerase sigma-32 factor
MKPSMKKGQTKRLKGEKTHNPVSGVETSPPKGLKSLPDSSLVKYDPLQRYLWEIGQYKLLSKEEEKELAVRVMEHEDRDAAYRLTTANLRLVVKIAMEFQRVWMQNLLDLIQEGNIGLMQAVRKFDPYKGVRFSYYASFWIKAYILKFIMDNWRLVKIGTTQAQRKLFFRLKKEKQKLISEGFDPKPKLLSERLGVTEQEVTDMDQRLDGWEISLDAPIKEGSDNERSGFVAAETVSAETQVARKEMGAILHQKLASFKKNLNQRELDILENRVFSDTPVTLQEIGKRYGISRERVRQVEQHMIKRMKSYFEREIPDFDSFLKGLSED